MRGWTIHVRHDDAVRPEAETPGTREPESPESPESPQDAARAPGSAVRNESSECEHRPGHQRDHVRVSQWESWVERQIREATERGEFDNLPGTGKPLNLSDAQDPDWWIKRYVAREGLDTSLVVHPTLALRREAAGYPASLVDVPTEDSVREIIRDYNRRVVEDRRQPVRERIMPPVAPRLDVEEMVAGWRVLRDELEREKAATAKRFADEMKKSVGVDSQPWWRRLFTWRPGLRDQPRKAPRD